MVHTFKRLKILLMRVFAAADSPISRIIVDRVVREADTLQRLRRNGLRPIRIIRAEPDRLLHQRTVRCEAIPIKEASTLNFLDTYFGGQDGATDWRITNSMQYRLVRAYMDGRMPQDFREMDYWQWHVNLREAGVNERSDEWITNKVQKLLRVFESISCRGYDYSRLSNYIWVLEKPLIHTRYGYDHCPDGYEIFDGHHRAASAACLGYSSVYVLLLKDVGKHTPFGVPLDKVVKPTSNAEPGLTSIRETAGVGVERRRAS